MDIVYSTKHTKTCHSDVRRNPLNVVYRLNNVARTLLVSGVSLLAVIFNILSEQALTLPSFDTPLYFNVMRKKHCLSDSSIAPLRSVHFGLSACGHAQAGMTRKCVESLLLDKI